MSGAGPLWFGERAFEGAGSTMAARAQTALDRSTAQVGRRRAVAAAFAALVAGAIRNRRGG